MSAPGWSADEIRRVGRLVVDLIADHLASLPGEPVFRPVPETLANRMASTAAPLEPAAPDDVLRVFSEKREPYPFGNGHPRFWGWVNSPPAEAIGAHVHAAFHVPRD